MENTKDKKVKNGIKTVNIPFINIPMMSDEEWNRLAYRNWIERNK